MSIGVRDEETAFQKGVAVSIRDVNEQIATNDEAIWEQRAEVSN